MKFLIDFFGRDEEELINTNPIEVRIDGDTITYTQKVNPVAKQNLRYYWRKLKRKVSKHK